MLESWKKIAIKAAGFGAGFALLAALIISKLDASIACAGALIAQVSSAIVSNFFENFIFFGPFIELGNKITQRILACDLSNALVDY